MKKTLLSLCLLAFAGANAQIANGSTAPNFTAQDLNGNTHTLSTYLSQGKDVLLNISATWCGPCWNYHNTHALADFYEAYGPSGSNEAMVLYVEGDNSTPVSALYGTGNNTMGNWVEGTPYPIINSGAIASQYQIAYFPTLFRICASTGTTFELNQLTAPNLRNNISAACGTLVGVANHGKITAGNIYGCTTVGDAKVELKNFGNNNITSAVIVLKENGNVVATQTYTGNLSQLNKASVTFSNVAINPSSTYVAEVQNINGGTIHNAEFGMAQFGGVFVAQEAQSTQLQVRVYTDNYPTEATWRIKNSAGTVVANGGPYSGSSNGGGVNANTTIIHNITIPNTSDCYSIELMDAYGDGWGYNSASAPTSGVEVFDGNTSLVFVDGSVTFSNAAPNVRPGAFRYGTASTGDLAKASFAVYPNPSTGVFNITTTELVDVKVVDVTGKVVYTAQGLDNNAQIDLTTFQKGVYLIQVAGETFKTTEKIIIN